MKTCQKQRRDSVSRETYWMRRDRDEKKEVLYGCPMDEPEGEGNTTGAARGIFWGLAFSALLIGVFYSLHYIANTNF